MCPFDPSYLKSLYAYLRCRGTDDLVHGAVTRLRLAARQWEREASRSDHLMRGAVVVVEEAGAVERRGQDRFGSEQRGGQRAGPTGRNPRSELSDLQGRPGTVTRGTASPQSSEQPAPQQPRRPRP